MNKLWLFRNLTNMTVGTLAFCLVGYYVNGVYSERKFEVPIVDQSVVLLNRNNEIKRLAGSPISYIGGSNSSATVNKEGGFYVFNFSGPTARLLAELTGECKSFEEFEQSRPYKRIEGVIASLESERKVTEERLNELQKDIKLVKPKSNEYIALQQQTKEVELRLHLQSEDIKEKKQEQLKLRRKYLEQFYIPDKKHYDELKQREKQDQPIPTNWKMWAITRLVADLPNGNKVFVVPSIQDTTNQAAKQEVDSEPKPWTFKTLNQRLEVDSTELSPQELEAYGRHKTRMLYSKYGNYRMSTMTGGFLLIAGGLLYYMKNRMVPLNNSMFLNEVKMLFERHPKIKRAGRYNWSSVVKGGRRGTEVEIEIDIMGELKGSIRVLAKYNDKKDEYSISKAEFMGTDKQRKQQTINLLIP